MGVWGRDFQAAVARGEGSRGEGEIEGEEGGKKVPQRAGLGSSGHRVSAFK